MARRETDQMFDQVWTIKREQVPIEPGSSVTVHKARRTHLVCCSPGALGVRVTNTHIGKLKRIRPSCRHGGYLESLEIKLKWLTQAPKDENYNQFQLSLSIRLVHYMGSVTAENHYVLWKSIKRLMNGTKGPTTTWEGEGRVR